MTPELEAKARRSRPYREELLKSLQSEEEAIAYLNAAYEDSQVAFEKAFRNVLSAERKWWIERIEQEREIYGYKNDARFRAFSDLLTSVRERG